MPARDRDEEDGAEVVPLLPRRLGFAPLLFPPDQDTEDAVSLVKDTAGTDLAGPQEHDLGALDGKVYEGEIVAYRQPLPTRPIFAAWIVDRDERRMAGRWAWQYGKHTVLFQVARVPKYAARTVAYSPRGLGRVALWWGRWVFDTEASALRNDAVERGDVAGYMALSRQRNDRVKTRLMVSGGIAAASITATAAAGWVYPVAPWAVLLVALVLLGWNGRRADRPLIDSAIISAPGARKLTADMVVRACIAAKLCTETDPITFVAPGVHRDGEGFRAVFDLPYGSKAATAIKRIEDLAAGLDVDEVRVFVDRVRGDTGSARRCSMWVADRDPYAVKPPVTPLVGMASVDFWKGFPFGIDARRRPINLALVWSSLLVGAIPRMGKTFAARLPVAAAGLDAHVRLIVADGKGGKDWKPFELIAHWYGSGVRLAVIEGLVQVLTDAVTDMNRRYTLMSGLSDRECPEGKLTPGLSRNRRHGMPLVLIAIDEVQRYLEHPIHGEAIADLLTELVKVGPAAGYMLVLATQKPDAKTIPPKLRDNTGTRFALKVMNYQSSDAVLGAGAYSDGLDASKLQRRHKGVGILLGADDGDLAEEGGQVVRTYLMDGPALTELVERARDLRIAAGTLTGTAAGEEVITEKPVTNLLDDVFAAFASGETRLWSETICARLAEANPDTYDGWEPATLAKALKPHGVETEQMELLDPDDPGGKRRRNLKGVTREALLQALAGR